MNWKTRITTSLCAICLAMTGVVSAEPRHFRFEGDIISGGSVAHICNLTLPARYEACYTVQSDAVDQEELPGIGLYFLSDLTWTSGDCRINSFAADDRVLYLNDGAESGEGRDVYNVQFYQQTPPYLRFQTIITAFELSDLVSSESVPTAAPDLSMANEVYSYLTGSNSGVGSIDTYYRDTSPCISTEDLLTDLVADIIALNLQTGLSNSLDAKLAAVFDALSDINE